MKTESYQRDICSRYASPFIPAASDAKLGISRNVGKGIWPINGLRHHPEGDTSGWYIWAGTEYSDAPDFFLPLHVAHIGTRVPEIDKFLGLAPGWRFLFDPTCEEVWFDRTLLQNLQKADHFSTARNGGNGRRC